MIFRHATAVFAAVILAAATVAGTSVVVPKKADAASTVKACTGGSISLTATEKRILDLHNRTRANYRLPLFCVHPILTNAARAHSQDMLNRDYFSHTSPPRPPTFPKGETFSARLKRFGYTPAGYRYYAIGENIAGGSGVYGTPDNRFNAWMRSTGHRASILNRNFREIGIGVRSGNFRGTNGYTMYTVDFGTRRR